MVVHYDGQVEAHSDDIELITWCSDDMTSRAWPNDINSCSIQIASDNPKICLTHSETVTGPLNLGWSEWRIIEIESKSHREFCNDDSQILPNELEYNISLERNRNWYSQLFATPLYVALMIILLNTWTPHPYRSGLCVVATIVLTILLLMMSDHVPLGYTPTLSI